MCLVDAISRIEFYLILFHLSHLKETYLLRNILHMTIFKMTIKTFFRKEYYFKFYSIRKFIFSID